MQTELNFLHTNENSLPSQKYLEANRQHLNNQCRKVWLLLNSGIRLTVMSAMNEYGVMSLPRRILDIEQKMEVKINREMTGRVVTYFI